MARLFYIRGDGNISFHQPGTLIEFLARGVNVKVPWKDGQRREVTGSSFAAARVAGLLARLLSKAPTLLPLQLKTLLHSCALPWPRSKPRPEGVSAC